VFGRWVREQSCDPMVQKLARVIVSDVPRGAPPEQDALAVADAVASAVRYTTIQGEVLPEDVAALIRMGAGDCDNQAVAIAALLLSLAWDVSLVFGLDETRTPIHVWTRAQAPGRTPPIDLDTTPGVGLGASPVGLGHVVAELEYPIRVDPNQPCCAPCASRSSSSSRGARARARAAGNFLGDAISGAGNALNAATGQSTACPDSVATASLEKLLECVEADMGISQASRDAAVEIGVRCANDANVCLELAERASCKLINVLRGWPFNVDVPLPEDCEPEGMSAEELAAAARAAAQGLNIALTMAYHSLVWGAPAAALDYVDEGLQLADAAAAQSILPLTSEAPHTDPKPAAFAAGSIRLDVPNVTDEDGDVGGAWVDWYREQFKKILVAATHVCNVTELQSVWYASGAFKAAAFASRPELRSFAPWPSTSAMVQTVWTRLQEGYYTTSCAPNAVSDYDYANPYGATPGVSVVKLKPQIKVVALDKTGGAPGAPSPSSSSASSSSSAGGAAQTLTLAAALIFALRLIARV